MGRHGCRRMNENGEFFTEFCGNNNLVIGGTLFQHKEIHKLTWVSPGGRDKIQIDHIAINGKWKRSLQDIRVKRGADVGSDHHLVSANIKLTLMNVPPKSLIRRIDTGKLKDNNVRQDFRLELKNRFQVLQHNGDGSREVADEKWGRICKLFSEASKIDLRF